MTYLPMVRALVIAVLIGQATPSFDYDTSVPLDPIRYLPRLKARTLLQFADDDFYVPKERAEALAKATPEPKEMRMYSAKHELNEEATRDRVAWLKRHLGLVEP